MKLLFTFIYSLITFSSFAQVKPIRSLPCDTWGPDQFLPYAEVGKTPVEQSKYMLVTDYTENRYLHYNDNKGAYFLYPESNDVVNNVQVVRWNIVNKEASYEFSVTDLYDKELYTTKGETACGVIILPDSLDGPVFAISIKRADGKYDLSTRNFSRVYLFKKNKEERLSILDEVQACSTLACKIEILQQHKKILDIFSLLELEKMKDPTNKNIDKLYWNMVSEMRYYESGQSELR